jgi:hypothetical protein
MAMGASCSGWAEAKRKKPDAVGHPAAVSRLRAAGLARAARGGRWFK